MFKWLNKLFKPKLTTIPEMVRFLKKKELNRAESERGDFQ